MPNRHLTRIYALQCLYEYNIRPKADFAEIEQRALNEKGPKKIDQILKQAKIDPNLRAEDLKISDWQNLNLFIAQNIQRLDFSSAHRRINAGQKANQN